MRAIISFFNRKPLFIGIIFLFAAALLFTSADPALAKWHHKSKGHKIHVGAAKVIVTPQEPVILGGKGDGLSSGVHDDLYARAVVISGSKTLAAIVSVDNCGLHLGDVKLVREAVEERYGISAQNLIVASTHSHNAPDLLGPYGGAMHHYTNDVYRPFLREQMVQCVGKALKGMQKAVVRVGSVEAQGMAFNRRFWPDEGPVDNELFVLQFLADKGNVIATLVNFSVHAVLAVNSTLISADAAGMLCHQLESEYGGIAAYTNGAIGDKNPAPYFSEADAAPYSPDFDPAGEEQYAAVWEYANDLSKYVRLALEGGETFKKLRFEVAKTVLNLPLENEGFIMLFNFGLIEREYFVENDKYYIPVEVFVMKMGPIQIATMPGEFFTPTQLMLKEALGEYGFVIGLAPEELGYIVSPDQFEPGRYEESMSVTSSTGVMDPMLVEALMGLID